jgi:serine acetyltransferase
MRYYMSGIIVGARAVVVDDVPDGEVVAGLPARILSPGEIPSLEALPGAKEHMGCNEM